MGIKQLFQLITKYAPQAIRKLPLEHFAGRIIACDASMAIYQFLIATQFTYRDGPGMMQDEAGNPTAHIVGLFNRTVQFLENGIKPVWVFDGAAPVMKGATLEERTKRKEEAKAKLEIAKDTGDMEEMKRQAQRTVKVTGQMMDDAKKVLTLLGVPVITAPGEAEAQCARMVANGLAFGVASEDLDTLTFKSPYLLRGFNSKKEPITQISYDEMIQGLQMTHEQFVDMCILCGCDYTSTIEGVGPTTAYKLIKEHSNIENAIAALKSGTSKKVKNIPEDFNFIGARELFLDPMVEDIDSSTWSWSATQEDALITFLVDEKSFARNRVESGIARMTKNVGKPLQSRLESFFTRSPAVKQPPPKKGKLAVKNIRKR